MHPVEAGCIFYISAAYAEAREGERKMKLCVRSVVRSVAALAISLVICMVISCAILNNIIPPDTAIYLSSAAIAFGFLLAGILIGIKRETLLESIVSALIYFVILQMIRLLFFPEAEANYTVTAIPLAVLIIFGQLIGGHPGRQRSKKRR